MSYATFDYDGDPDEMGIVIEDETVDILKAKGYENNWIVGLSELNGNGFKYESVQDGLTVILRLVPEHSGN